MRGLTRSLEPAPLCPVRPISFRGQGCSPRSPSLCALSRQWRQLPSYLPLEALWVLLQAWRPGGTLRPVVSSALLIGTSGGKILTEKAGSWGRGPLLPVRGSPRWYALEGSPTPPTQPSNTISPLPPPPTVTLSFGSHLCPKRPRPSSPRLSPLASSQYILLLRGTGKIWSYAYYFILFWLKTARKVESGVCVRGNCGE